MNPIGGITGTSMINTKTKDEGSKINCAALLDYNGYITIHLSAAQSATFVTQGAIRQNELAGELKEDALANKDTPGIDEVAKF